MAVVNWNPDKEEASQKGDRSVECAVFFLLFFAPVLPKMRIEQGWCNAHSAGAG